MTQYPLRTFLLLSIILVITIMAGAQNVRIPEEEFVGQSAFIDANREMILGNLEKAETLYRELQRKYPTNHAVSYALAQLLFTREDFHNALTAIRQARSLSDDNIWYTILEADILERTGRFQDAAILYAGLAEAHPKEAYYYEQWAFYLIKAGDAKGAIAVYDRTEKELGFQEEFSQKKYMLYRGMGDMKAAAAVLEEVLQRQPWNQEVMYTLAEFYEENGALEDAKKWYRRILEKHPGESEAQLAMVRIENPDQAAGPLAQLSTVFRDRQADLDNKIIAIIPHIQAFADHRDPALGMALDSLTTILDQTHPDQAKVASIRGDLAYYRGQYEEAIAAYLQALSREKTIFAIWDQLLQATSAGHAFQAQKKYAEEALDVFPNQGQIHYYLAESLLETGFPEDARSEISLAKLMARKDGYLLYHLAILEGRTLSALHQPDQAKGAFDQALSINPNGAEALAYRSLAVHTTDDRCRDAESAQRQAPHLPVVVYAVASCAFLRGEYAQAKTILEGLLASTTFAHADWVELLGDVYAMTGDAGMALKFWKLAIDKGGASPQLKRKVSNQRYEE
ncbi:MAG: tetratricopeptide repeat protein [Saprospiraceae bacterium]|nr:tetratricopeptide repeat protein [Saprospiraceae bacterium]